uniref:Uncharacterized protein n=1 Tax=Sphaerodactylus townsendi TaxID=933632 RepID=A0ACB8EW25_9SAUR
MVAGPCHTLEKIDACDCPRLQHDGIQHSEHFVDIKVEKGKAIQRELQEKASGRPGDAYFEVCDVRKETDIKRLISATLERYGCLDCLANNAGTGHTEKIDDVTAQDFRNMMEYNTLSILLTSKHALPFLRKTRGNIINMASIAGMFGVKNKILYSISKDVPRHPTQLLGIGPSIPYHEVYKLATCPHIAVVSFHTRKGLRGNIMGAKVGQAIQRELQDSGYPGDAYFEVCDVRKEADIKRLISATLERYGCLDCLVNNVGDVRLDKIDDVTAQGFHNVMELNTLSILLASKYALPYLRETKGNIINMASIAGMIGMKHSVTYSSSKLLGRFGTPEEVALAALYLAADGTFCTGFNLVVSGGAEVGFGKKAQVDSEPGSGASGNSQDSSSKQ